MLAVTVREALEMIQQRKLATDPDLPEIADATIARFTDMYRTVLVGTDVPIDELGDTMEEVKAATINVATAALRRTRSIEEVLLALVLNTATIYVDSFLAGVLWQQRQIAAESASRPADGPLGPF